MNSTYGPPNTFGYLDGSIAIPQVRAALNVLVGDGQELAGFAESHQCVSGGAYLDPRSDTGEVVLAYCQYESDHCYRTTVHDRHDLREERELVVIGYADLFRAANWQISEFREPDQNGVEWIVRLILTPPVV